VTKLASPTPRQHELVHVFATFTAAASLVIVLLVAALYVWFVSIPLAWQARAWEIQQLLPLAVPLGVFAVLYGRKPTRVLGLLSAIAAALPLSLVALLVVTWTSDVGWTNPILSREAWAIPFVALMWSSIAVGLRGRSSRWASITAIVLSCASAAWAILLITA